MAPILSFILASFILVHSWYPAECCSGQDCEPVPCKEIIAQDDGSFKYKDYIFPKGLMKSSPDGFCHVCIAGRNPRCVFLPAGS